ncbi:MAG: 5'-nucleotidase C-terminal domain-containing protein [Microbacteriaceae bacterium]|nr:5'-nucleotidase C-terminal domain-containing protein [Microbacteriaceae bacterium]
MHKKSSFARRSMAAVAGVALVASAFTAQSAAYAQNADDIVTLDLYNLTDVHGHIAQKADSAKGITEAGLPAIACYLNKKKVENPNTSFTLLGDNIGASPFETGILYDNPTIAALNKLKPLSSTLGNHELDLGQEALRARATGGTAKVEGKDVKFEKIEFPYRAINVTGSLDDVLKSNTDEAVIIKEIAGVKVAYVSGIASDVPFKLDPGATNGMTFHDGVKAINAKAKELKESKKADIVIAMYDDDVKNNLPLMGEHVDGLMGGDTHVPYAFNAGENGNRISGIASGSYTDNLANLQIKFNKTTKKIVESKALLTTARDIAAACDKDAIAADPVAAEVQKIVDKAKADAKVEGDKPVASGYKAGFARGIHNVAGPGSNRGTESTLSNLIADSFKASITDKAGKPVDIGIINAGGIRDDLAPTDGNITYKQAFNVMPFGNDLGYITLTGAEFKKALEQQWKTNLSSQNSRPMLKLGVSDNVRYTYDPARDAGDRVTSILVNGKPIDPAKNYTVGSVTFLLNGGDSFDAFKGKKIETNSTLDRDAFAKYLGAQKNGIAPSVLKRSVGVTAVKEGDSVNVALRGLSFTEGPGKATDATVVLGAATSTEKVNNSLEEKNANNEKSIITTDGAGQASLSLKVADVCAGKSGKQNFPITVSNNFGALVTPANGVIVAVDCGAATATAPSAPTPVSATVANVATEQGMAPALPKTASVKLSDGTVKEAAVAWVAVAASEYDGSKDSFAVNGTVTVDGKILNVTTTVIVKKKAQTVITQPVNPTQPVKDEKKDDKKADDKKAKDDKKLANTGAEAATLPLAGAAVLVLAGAVMLLARRRKVSEK